MTPRFFIDRPIFAAVLSVLITLAGSLAVFTLPISQYPQVTPPTIQIDCNYPGANARIVADTVAAPIEQQVNGVEDMLYMASQCTSDGSYTLTVTFKIGADLNMSQIRVLNRVALAYPQLPDVVNATGVTTRKRSAEILMTLALSSPGGRYNQLFLSNYGLIRVRDELSRLPGVSDVLLFGQRDYSMRIWLDPDKLATRNLTAGDVVNAIQQQNQPLVAGQLAQPPTGDGQPLQVPITGVGRLKTVEEFERVVVKVGDVGRIVQVKDVARVELGAKAEDVSNTFDNKPTVGLAIFLLADANALEAHDRILAKMDELAKEFPPDLIYEIGYDTTPFIRESIHEVFKSLWESIALVALVVLVFLQSWRAAIIPLAAVPVAIIGTFAAMAVLGYTINNLTLFGLVLAVGIVVDDAIVVVEAVQHHLEKGLAPRMATIRAMEDVAGPVMAVGVVLSAVFIPCAFLSGIVGQFFRQFAVTIAVSTMISTFNSLTLSPALCAILLKPSGPGSGQRPFPRLLCPAIGAGLGFAVYVLFFDGVQWLIGLPGWCAGTFGVLCDWIKGGMPQELSWLVPAMATALGAGAGWLLTRHRSTGPVPRAAWPVLGAGLAFATIVELAPALDLIAAFFKRAANEIPELSDSAQACKGQLGEESWWLAPALVMLPAAVIGGLLVNPVLEWFFGWFNRGFTRAGNIYVRLVGASLRVPIIVPVYCCVLVLGGIGYGFLPTGFIPQQDKGYLIASIQLPDATAAEKTKDAIEKIAKTIRNYAILIESRKGEEGAFQLTERVKRDGKPAGPDARGDVLEVGQWVKPVRPVKHCNSVAGNSFVLSAYGSNFGSMFIILDGYDVRRHGSLYADEVRTRLVNELDAVIPEASVAIFGAPAVSGLGRAGGFRYMIEDRGDVGPEVLREQTDNFIAKSRQLPQVAGLFTVYKTNSPQIFVDIDRTACLSKGVALADVNTALQACMGAQYVNDFNLFGRTWQVNVQADHAFRDELEDIYQLKVRNIYGGMVPLAAVVKVKETFSPLVISRYNMYPAAAVNGNVAAGVSTGDARIALDTLASNELPPTTMSGEWTEIAFIEQLAGKSELRIPGIYTFRGDTTVLVFGLSVSFVFLVLAALYESWAFPLAVILVVPVCVVCSLAAVWITDPGTAVESLKQFYANDLFPSWLKPGEWGMTLAAWLDAHPIKGANRLVSGAGVRKGDVNIFTQVGFVVLIGLACKNAILIVEFARVSRNKGAELRTAVLDACRLRFRPILMTSVAFILGVLPLVVATGAGSEMRQALGVAVIGGMTGVTLFGIFLTPIFFSLVDRLSSSKLLSNKYVCAVSDAFLYALGCRFVRPMVGAMVAAGADGLRRVAKGKAKVKPPRPSAASGNGIAAEHRNGAVSDKSTPPLANGNGKASEHLNGAAGDEKAPTKTMT